MSQTIAPTAATRLNNPNEPHLGDPKKMGVLGAPPCRCTPLVLALCVALSGLIALGAGSCIAGFLWYDETPKSLGLTLLALGVLMIFAGVGLFCYNSVPAAQRRETAYSYRREDLATANQPSTSASPQPAWQSSDRHVAPPSYDAVLQEDREPRETKAATAGRYQSNFTSTSAV